MNICAIFKNEALYLREWLEFHLLVGVEKFYLYNNDSEDDYMFLLAPYIEAGQVELTEWPMKRPSQFAAYQHHIDNHHGEHWTAFIDCDEFLWSPRFATIPEALAVVPVPRSAIGVNWMCFGSGGQEEWQDAPVIERFTWRIDQSNGVNAHIKSLIWMDQQVHVGSDPHFFQVEHGTFSECGQGIGSAFSNHSSSLLRINHYCSKSKKEWEKRILLGKPDRAGIEIDANWYWGRQAQEVDDHEIQRYLPALKEKLAQRETTIHEAPEGN